MLGSICISILLAKEKIGSVLHAAAFLFPCSLLFLLTGSAVDLFASHFSMHCVSSWDNILIALSTMHSTMHNRFSPHVIFLDSAATHSKEVQGCSRTDPHSYETTRIKGPPSAWGLASERDERRNRNVTQLWFCHLKSWNTTMLNVSWHKAFFFSDAKSRPHPPHQLRRRTTRRKRTRRIVVKKSLKQGHFQVMTCQSGWVRGDEEWSWRLTRQG